MALSIANRDMVDIVHAGDPATPALRDYLGMGLPRLTVLPVPEGIDPAPALLAYLRQTRPTIILTGTCAETGEAAGFLPYWLAAELDIPLLSEVVELSREMESWQAILAAPGGRRRRMHGTGPLIATTGRGAPAAPFSAFGPARRGNIVQVSAVPLVPLVPDNRTIAPARRRPKRLAAASTAQNATGAQVGLSADEAARTIADFLKERGFLS